MKYTLTVAFVQHDLPRPQRVYCWEVEAGSAAHSPHRLACLGNRHLFPVLICDAEPGATGHRC
jgi:hypothetical protein